VVFKFWDSFLRCIYLIFLFLCKLRLRSGPTSDPPQSSGQNFRQRKIGNRWIEIDLSEMI
jgi:hypothetical protein